MSAGIEIAARDCEYKYLVLFFCVILLIEMFVNIEMECRLEIHIGEL